MKPTPLFMDFAARVFDLTGEMPDREDLDIFEKPGWVHIIHRSEGRSRVGWSTYKSLGRNLPRMLSEKWPE